MKAIDFMMEEHKYIKRKLTGVRSACFKEFPGEEGNYEDFYLMIDFIRK